MQLQKTKTNFFHLGVAGYDPSLGRPKLAEWLKLVRETTNPYYDDAHHVVNKLMMENSDIPEYLKGNSV